MKSPEIDLQMHSNIIGSTKQCWRQVPMGKKVSPISHHIQKSSSDCQSPKNITSKVEKTFRHLCHYLHVEESIFIKRKKKEASYSISE